MFIQGFVAAARDDDDYVDATEDDLRGYGRADYYEWKKANEEYTLEAEIGFIKETPDEL